MAGYYLNSIEWDRFRRFVDEPTRPQLLALAGLVAEGLEQRADEIEDDDPIRSWPQDPEALCGPIADRLKRRDWYGDLSDPGKTVWGHAVDAFCDDVKKTDMCFRVEADPVYWTVIDLARAHHEIPTDWVTADPLSRFGFTPFRYHPPTGRRIDFFEWHAYHSMHPPDEAAAILDALRAAEPTIRASADENAIDDYDNRLIPALESVARDGRMLYVGVDT